jgi:hypothetical protein
MKSIYESIKGILSEGPATNPNAQGKEYTNPRMPGYYKNKSNAAAAPKPAVSTPAPAATSTAPAKDSPAAKSLERGQALKNALGLGDKNKTAAAAVPAPKADTSSDAAKPGTWGNPKTSNPLIAKNREMVAKQQATGVNQAPGRAGPGSYEPAPGKNKTDAAQIPKPATTQPFKRPMNGALLDGPDSPSKKPAKNPTVTAKPAADNAPTSNDAPKPAATDATSLAKAQGKEVDDKPADTGTDDRAARAMATPSKRASILPADTMQKNLDQARKNLGSMMGNDEEPSKTMAAKVDAPKAEEPKAETPKADEKDYSTGRPADKELDDKYGKSNSRTDADGRTYVRQKGVMGSPDTENRSYASIGDFVNKIRGKGDVNGKVTAKEAYVNKTFGVSRDLVADIMEVMKKKESSTPRNDKEQDLAAHYGDPKRITHGDILVARGVVKQKKVQEGTMRNGKYVDDAPRPGTNEVPSPDEGYRGAGKPLYTPVDGKKSGKKAQPGSKTNEAAEYELDPKMKTPNQDIFHKVKEISTPQAYFDDVKGQQKYKSRTSGGLMNKIKDKLGVDKPDENYGPKKESMDTPGNGYAHQCAIHVRSESFGEGRTVTTQHADPDHNGDIAWYDVMFEHGIEKFVPTAELEILVSESHMHSKRKKVVKEEGEQPVLKTADDWEKEKQKKAQANQPAMSYAGNQGNQSAQEPAQAAAPAPAPAQATAAPKPAPSQASSDALSAIDGGSIGTSQSSFQTGPKDLKQGIAANAPAARVVSTSAGAKEAGVPQPNQRIAGFKSNARAREQAAGAFGVEAPMPGGGGKTIAQVRQDMGGKPVSGTPAADAAAKQNMAGNAPAARVVSKQDQAYPQGDKTVGNYDYKNKQLAANPSGSGSAPVTRQASSVPAPQPVESPEEKARKAAAQKKPALATSYQGQGMVGTDY